MNLLIALPNLLAMIASLAGMVLLTLVQRRLGGQLGAMLRLVNAGVFLAVFLHAAAELAEALGVLGHATLPVVMSVLLTAGSIAFGAAGLVGLKALR
jgi:hypothetical protein